MLRIMVTATMDISVWKVLLLLHPHRHQMVAATLALSVICARQEYPLNSPAYLELGIIKPCKTHALPALPVTTVLTSVCQP
jgi:hypothetical protein